MLDASGLRDEAVARVLGVHADLDRVSVGRDADLRDERFTERDAQLQFDEVEPRHHLGDRMLDL